jgi:hypothetical protein
LHPQVNSVRKLSITCRLDYSYELILNRWWLYSLPNDPIVFAPLG